MAELALGAKAFGVGLEVATQVRPADLPPAGGQVTVGPAAIGGHHAVVAGEQLARLALVTVGRDAVDRQLVGERAPQRAPFAGVVVSAATSPAGPPRQILEGDVAGFAPSTPASR